MEFFSEGVNPVIRKQIKKREEIFGKFPNRTVEQLTYLNSRTSWASLVSSVDVLNTDRFKAVDIDLLRESLGQNKLAKQFVLRSGVVDKTASDPLKAGISRRPSDILTPTAYGYGGLEFGQSPMPGIQSVSVTSVNAGKLRDAELKIRANNRIQLEIIDALYLRLGFTVLLEWGHAMYYKNDGTLVTDITKEAVTLEDEFLEGYYKNNQGQRTKLDRSTIYKALEERRYKGEGNYDAMWGVVIGYMWTFASDGAYDITLKLTSMGDLIESLKINTLTLSDELTPQKSVAATNTLTAPTSNQLIANIPPPNKERQLAAQATYQGDIVAQTGVKPVPIPTDIVDDYDASDLTRWLVRKRLELANQPIDQYCQTLTGEGGKIDHISVTYKGIEEQQQYVRMGALLSWIRDNKFLQSPTVSGSAPLLGINTDTRTNYIYYNRQQAPICPTVCMFNTTFNVSTGGKYTYLPKGEIYAVSIPKTTKTNDASEARLLSMTKQYDKLNQLQFQTTVEVGQLLNLYLNANFIRSCVDAGKDSNGDCMAVDFFKNICQGLNVALGKINNLDTFIDQEKGEFKIVDNTPLPGLEQIITYAKTQGVDTQFESAEFHPYGYFGEKINNETNSVRELAGFVTKFDFTTQLSRGTLGMLTIGAQAGGVEVGEDATAFSRWNVGLQDRIRPRTYYKNGMTNQTGSVDLTLEEKYTNVLPNYNQILQKLSFNNEGGPSYVEEEVEVYTETLANLLSYKQAYDSVKTKQVTPSIGALPIELSMTMLGLSGLKILQTVGVDSTYLPSNYNDTLTFVIFDQSHKIENNEWSTTVRTYSVPKSLRTPANDYAVTGGKRQSKRGSIDDKPTSISETRRGIVEKIIDYAKSLGITDRNRMTAIIAVGWAETTLIASKVEGDKRYSAERAREIFPSKLKKVSEAQLRQWVSENPQKALYDAIYQPGGWTYRGRGLTQCTFDYNYKSLQLAMNKSPYNLNINLVNNPDLLLQEDISVKALVIGKIEGVFGKRLSSQRNYLVDGLSVLQTQNGGGRQALNVLSNYDDARIAVNTTEWIQQLFKSKGIN
jgi:predicted chitinase